MSARMNARLDIDNDGHEQDPLVVHESRDFRSYHAFLRAARNYMEGPLVGQLHDRYERAHPTPASDWRAAQWVLDELNEFQFYCWAYRNLQRFKYHRPTLGIFATLERDRDRLERALDAAAAETLKSDPTALRLDPSLSLPEYFRYVPFHQHTGGVAGDSLAGLAYEIGRRTTVPAHADPNGIYRILFDALPQREYARVLDWGVGHGAALITWQQRQPQSECHGVDLSAPCLKVANLRARERGMRFLLSQQDLEHLDYPDAHFDLVFFNFMLHELPPAHTPALLAEAARVLKPGGLFAGHEFHLRPGDAFQNVLQRTHAWTNNETYSTPWYDTPIGEWARAAGFAKVSITPFERLNRSVRRPGKAPINANHWNLYVFEK
ncbi:MAG: methyltransferase domain-containing protein [Gammaproteobacteria bacterium]|nr:methyltransferase domain-containing protein [Gammaproteobacteria bacterium]NDA43039.1 methyltransferase domain-containing protein [Gammaproteobacteria bacterium]